MCSVIYCKTEDVCILAPYVLAVGLYCLLLQLFLLVASAFGSIFSFPLSLGTLFGFTL